MSSYVKLFELLFKLNRKKAEKKYSKIGMLLIRNDTVEKKRLCKLQ